MAILSSRTPSTVAPFVCFFAVLFFFTLWRHIDPGPFLPFGGGCTADSSSSRPLGTRELIERATRDKRENADLPKIVVLNLASRPDRKEHMEGLADALEFELTFMNATPSASPEIIWIQERLYDDSRNVSWNFGAPGTNDTWRSHYLTTDSASLLPPPSPTLPTQAHGLKFPDKAILGVDSLPGPLACYASHLALLRRMVAENWGTTIVLEDDIDLEWRFKERWSEVVDRSLPAELDWQILYLGYSFTREELYRPIYSPFLRTSYAPLGTYAYALSPTGARALLAHLTSPSTVANLFTRPIDHAYREYARLDRDLPIDKRRPVFSFVPALVGHGGKIGMGSDIGGTSGVWETMLSDSTMRRMRAYRKLQHAGREEEEPAA